MDYLFERIGRAFSFIWASVKMAFKDKDLLVPSLLSIVANIAYIAVIIAALYATDNLWLAGIEQRDVQAVRNAGDSMRRTPQDALDDKIEEARAGAEAPAADASGEPEAAPAVTAETAPPDSRYRSGPQDEKTRQYMQYGFYVVTILGAFIITYFFTAMTISLVHAHIMGRDARVGDAFAVVTRRMGGIVLLAVMATIVEIIASMARDKKGRETFLSSLIARLWTVASFLILPAIVIEDFSMWRALKRAREIAAKNLLIVAVGEIAVTMVGNIIGFLGVVGGVVVGYFTYSALPQPIYVPIALGGIIVIFTMAFVSFVKVAYYTCLYVNAVETARVGKRVLPVGPLAAALE